QDSGIGLDVLDLNVRLLISNGINDAFVGILDTDAVANERPELKVVAHVAIYRPLIGQLKRPKTRNLFTGSEAKVGLSRHSFVAYPRLQEAELRLKGVALIVKAQ